MGWVVDSLIDWFWTGFVLRLRERYPPWVWITAALSPVILLALLAGAAYLAFA